MEHLLVFAAFICTFLALLIAAGAHIFGTTWQEWIAAALALYFLSKLVPWYETRKRAAAA